MLLTKLCVRFASFGMLVALLLHASSWRAEAQDAMPFLAGEGVVDISPPLGTALGGFRYRDPSKPRVTTGIHYPPEVRALVLKRGDEVAVILSIDMLNVSFAWVKQVQEAVASETKVPARCVRVCATHAHSMPSIAFNRHWGNNHPEYETSVVRAAVKAVQLGQQDLSSTKLFAGRAAAPEASRNRTAKEGVKSDREFTADSTDADRWIDTIVHVLHFRRADGKRDLLWYNFAAHPITYGSSTLAGPDWPSEVHKSLQAAKSWSPSFLQGHIGDINPQSREQTASKVTEAILKAVETAREVPVTTLRTETQEVKLPLDIPAFQKQIEKARAQAASGKPLDAFNQDWFDMFASRYDLTQTELPITLAAVRIGDVGLLFHPSELYSYYGLAIQRDSPLTQTLVVGYADGYVGYLPDPTAYTKGEYAAVMVPTILNFPQFTPNAGREMTRSAVELLTKIAK